MRKQIIVIVFLIFLIGVGLFVYFGQRKAHTEELYYSGTIEAIQSELSFQVNGRIVSVLVDEGQFVKKDQLLAKLDKSQYVARCEEARAYLNQAEKSSQRVKNLLEVYKQTLPAEVERARAGVSSAKVILEEARRNKERYNNLYENNVVSRAEWENATLHNDTARAKLCEANAVLKQANSNLKKLKVTRKEIEVAEAQYLVAKAVLSSAEIQLGYTQLRSPFSGTITSRNIEPGEVVITGRGALTLSDLTTVDLKIFVGETEIGKVKPGQKIHVKTDSFPDKVYTGTVSFISPEGEFTPKIIQTHKERVKLVYLVKVSIPNPDLELKSGMPADAWLQK
ncbi:MAG: HlyD family efflux transporter periplasmic adaptor subunit [Syntrophobacterales bacterium]|nr:HlyD family efflux transporter periplasmic adaptor subunit [Syntrophobacterales bacterium]